MRTIFEWMVFFLVLIIPVLSMGLLAQEWSTGTIETMMTAPVSEIDMVTGKFLGSLMFFVTLLVPTLIYLAMLALYGRPDYSAIFTGYLGIILVGALFISIGLFCSSLTRSLMVAAVSTVAVLSLLTVVPWYAGSYTTVVGFSRKLVDQGVFSRYVDFSKGIIDTGNVVYFLAGTGVFLFLTVKVLESRRWK
jgi:ABC-2 type transport system permease protein